MHMPIITHTLGKLSIVQYAVLLTLWKIYTVEIAEQSFPQSTP